MTQKKTKIPVKRVLADIRLGMSDSDLLEKYHITAKQLPEVFSQLVRQGFITEDELRGRDIFQSTDDLTTAIFGSFKKDKD